MHKIVEAFLQSIDEPDAFDHALDLFVETLGALSVCTVSLGNFDTMKTEGHFSAYGRTGAGKEIAQMFMGGEDESDREGFARLFTLPIQTLVSEHQALGLPADAELPYSHFREVGKKFGLDYRFASVLNQNGPWLDGVFLHARESDKALVTEHKKVIDAILPVMAHTIEMRRMYNMLSAQFAGLMEIMNNLGLGVFLLNEDAGVIASNFEAKRILHKEDGLSQDRFGRLRARNEHDTMLLMKALRDVFSTLNDDGTCTKARLSFSRKSREFDFLAALYPLPHSMTTPYFAKSSAMMIVIDPTSAQKLSTIGISMLGGLTEAESEVASLLVEGKKVSEICEQRQVSQNTVRFQLKSIGAKLRCSSQSDIVRLAAATKLPINPPDHQGVPHSIEKRGKNYGRQ